MSPAAQPGDVVLHPERTGDPAAVRWHVRHTLLTDPGGPATAPLRALVRDGVLAGFALGLDDVTTTLGAGHTWRDAAAAVRTAVRAAVVAGDERLGQAGPLERDHALAELARRVLADIVGPVARAHGGTIEYVTSQDGVVTVRLRGACHGCPAAGATLHGLLERELQDRLPWAVEVRATA